MRLTVWLFGREFFAAELAHVASEEASAEYVSNLSGELEDGPEDDGTRWSPYLAPEGEPPMDRKRMGFFPYA